MPNKARVSFVIRFKNQIISSLAASEIEFLIPHLEAVDLPLRMALTLPNTAIESVVFIEQGLGSVIAVSGGVDQIEVGLIGRDGLVGLSALLGEPLSMHKIFMQVAGRGYRLPVALMKEAIDARQEIRAGVLKFANKFLLQVSQTALANGRYKVPARLARWLLLSSDRLGGDLVPLTNEFLGLMLGIRRAGVTEALAELEALRFILTSTGKIKIVDRPSLKALAVGIYES